MNQKPRQSWWASTIKYSCPRCRKGSIFIHPMKWSSPLDMPEKCDHCGLNFAPEPGFYYGAMFLSYILSGWILLLIALALVFYFKWSVESAMLVVLGIGGLSYFKLMRFSRSLYIHLLVRYDPNAEDLFKEK